MDQQVTGMDGEVFLRLLVQPRASRNAIICDPEGRIRVAVTSPAVEGAANRALQEFVSKALGIPKRSVRLVSGGKAREKTIGIRGIGAEEVRSKLMEGNK